MAPSWGVTDGGWRRVPDGRLEHSILSVWQREFSPALRTANHAPLVNGAGSVLHGGAIICNTCHWGIAHGPSHRDGSVSKHDCPGPINSARSAGSAAGLCCEDRWRTSNARLLKFNGSCNCHMGGKGTTQDDRRTNFLSGHQSTKRTTEQTNCRRGCMLLASAVASAVICISAGATRILVGVEMLNPDGRLTQFCPRKLCRGGVHVGLRSGGWV